MKMEEFDQLVDLVQERCRNILAEKAKHYAGKEDRLEQFVRAGVFAGVSSAEALFGMMSKHLVSIAMMMETPWEHTKKQWDEKITDSINYLILLEAVLTDMGIE